MPLFTATQGRNPTLARGDQVGRAASYELDLIWLVTLRYHFGMNCLHIYGAKIDCENLKVILRNENGREVCFYG